MTNQDWESTLDTEPRTHAAWAWYEVLEEWAIFYTGTEYHANERVSVCKRNASRRNPEYAVLPIGQTP